MIEKSILKLFMSNREAYETYSKHLDLSYIKTNFGVLYKLFNVIKLIYLEERKKTCSVEELEGQFIASYPMLKEVDRKELSLVLESVAEAPVGDSVVALLEAHKVRALASNAALIALDVAEGKKTKEELIAVIETLGNTQLEDESNEFETLPTDIELLAEEEQLEPGLQWKLIGLRKSLGPLRKGNFGHIFARIETGKTAMWINEGLHMATQMKDGETLDIFFNEEDGKGIIWRMYANILRWDYQQILGNPKKAKELFYEKLGGEKIRFFDRASLSRKFIEKAVEKGNPKLIIIDNMDKVKGFDDDRKDLQLANCYKWGRELAKGICPVVSVGQADNTATNQMWVSESQMADGKTGKPSETDFAIGIGRTDSSQHPFERFIYVSRNKLKGDEGTIENLRHAKFTAILSPQYSSYEEGGVHAIR